MPSPRVIHVITAPAGGGAEILVRQLHRRLPALGVASEVIYFANPAARRLGPGEHCLDTRSPRSPGVIPRLRRALSRLGVDETTVLHAHLTWPLYFLPPAASGLAGRRVYTEHSTHNRRRDHRILRPLERSIYRRYDAIACISEGVRRALAGWLGDERVLRRMRVIHNGVEMRPPRDPVPPPRDGLSLVSVGSLTRHKGLDTAIRAVAGVRDRVARYLILGEGPEREALERLIAGLGLEDVVTLAGWQEDTGAYLNQADLCLMPSKWEGFGLAAVEALSAGLPVVASDVAGLREVLGGASAARLVPAEDPGALAAAIGALHDALLAGHDFRAGARSHAGRFGLSRMVEEYAQLYADMAECPDR